MESKLPLLNCHTHIAMLAFRGLAEDMPLDKWLNDYIWPNEAKCINSDFVYRNAKKAIIEMQKNKIRAFSDMYFFESSVAKAAIELKMKAVIGEAILNFKTPSANTPEQALEITENLLKKYKNNALISVAVAPHSIYMTSKDILIKAKKLAKKYDAIYHIHASETKKEFDDCKKQNQLTPIQYLKKLNVLDQKSTLAHCVWVTDNDLKIIKNSRSSVIHCPLSNLKLGSGIAPISKMLKIGINVCLGTDGPASSNRLDILEAGKFASLLQKGINLDPTQLPAKKIIEMMTINGMRALNIKSIDKKNIKHVTKIINTIKNYSFIYN